VESKRYCRKEEVEGGREEIDFIEKSFLLEGGWTVGFS